MATSVKVTHATKSRLEDASLIAFIENSAIDAVLSFDDDFDGLVDRIDPNRSGNELLSFGFRMRFRIPLVIIQTRN